jgi:uncharacterized surface protein with fasciclin (FAS1) repeats
VRKFFIATIIASLALTSCTGGEVSDATSTSVDVQIPGDIVAVTTSTEDFSVFVSAVSAANLIETLQGDGPFTVLAPTDEAFGALPQGLLDKLLLPENSEILIKILTYHVIAGKHTSTEIVDGDLPSVEGSSVRFSTSTGIQVNDATVTLADIDAKNGIIHAIDKVLIPPSVDVGSL